MHQPNCFKATRGFTVVELLITIASCVVIVVLYSFWVGGLGSGRPPDHGVVEQTRISQIHKAMYMFSREYNGAFPRPGLVNRLAVNDNGVMREIPGKGDEDVSLNTTAGLFSMLIAQNYFTPELCVSPLDRNPNVTVRSDYNAEAYKPSEDSYWDPNFTADLETGSNVSYAHLVMFGQRVAEHWCDSLDETVPLLSNRGPSGGKGDPKSFTCDRAGTWSGNVLFADGHVIWLETMTPDKLMYMTIVRDTGEKKEQPDNMFAMETGATGADVILSFTKTVTEKGAEIQHD